VLPVTRTPISAMYPPPLQINNPLPLNFFLKNKLAPSWPQNRSPVEFGAAMRSILKMLRDAVPNSLGDRV
jgi:hypothetical protein